MSINSKIRRVISFTTRLGRLTYRISKQLETGGLSDCGISDDSGAFLYRSACQRMPIGDVVEIGSCYGRSTLYLAAGVRASASGCVWAVDPHTGDCSWDRTKSVSTYDIFRRNIHKFGFDQQVRPLKMTSQAAAAQWPGSPIRLLFIDGWHSYEAVSEDIALWFPWLVPGGVIAFDDYWNPAYPGVQRGIDEQMMQRKVQLPLQRAGGIAWTTKL